MKTGTFKYLLVFGLIAASLCVSAARGSQTASPGGKSSETSLTFWNFWDPKFILPVIAEFEAQNPGVKIKNEQITWRNGLDKIVTALANGLEPDIVELGSTWTGKFMAEGVLLDITDQVSDLKPDYLFWDASIWKGRIYAMPWLVGTRVLFYNRDVFAAAGLDPDVPPVTWDEMVEAARKVHNPESGVYGFGINAGEGHILYKKFFPFSWGIGGRILDENDQLVINDKPIREAFDIHRRLMEYSLMEKRDVLDDAFKRGRLGMSISGSGNFAKFQKESPDLNFGVALIPKHSHEKGTHRSFLGGQVLSLFKSCKNPAIGAKFIRFLTEARHTLPITKETLVSFPASRKAFSDPFFTADPRLLVFVEQMKSGVHPPVHPLWIELESIINRLVESVLFGADPDVSLAAAEAEYERVKKRFETRQAHQEGAKEPAVPEATQSSGGFSGYGLVLLSLTAFATLINSILLFLLYSEVKKKAS